MSRRFSAWNSVVDTCADYDPAMRLAGWWFRWRVAWLRWLMDVADEPWHCWVCGRQCPKGEFTCDDASCVRELDERADRGM